MGFFISYQSEGRIYAAYILKNQPNATIAVMYQDDDFGKDYLKGVVDGLGAKASMIKAKATYETSGPRPSTRRSSSCRRRAAMSSSRSPSPSSERW